MIYKNFKQNKNQLTEKCWEQHSQIDDWQNLYWGTYLFWARQLLSATKPLL